MAHFSIAYLALTYDYQMKWIRRQARSMVLLRVKTDSRKSTPKP